MKASKMDKEDQKLIEGSLEEMRKKYCRRSTLTCCVLYFFLSCRDSLTIFLVPFFTSLGLSIAESACLYSVQSFSILFTPFFIWLSIRTGRRKLCFLVVCVGCIFTVYLIPIIAHKQETKCERFTGSLFIKMLLLMIANAFFHTPIKGIVDMFVLRIFNEPNRNMGGLRIFCAIGLSFSCLLSGFVTNIYATNSDADGTIILSRYMGVFFTNIPFYVFLIIIGIFAELQGKWDTSGSADGDDAIGGEDSQDLCRTCGKPAEDTRAKPNNVMILISALVLGIGTGARHTFLFQFLQDSMQSTAPEMGLSYVCLGIGQVVGYLSANILMDCIGGPLILFEIAILGYLPSYLLLNTLDFTAVCCSQVPIGMCTAFFWLGCIRYAKDTNEEWSYESLFVSFNWTFNWLGGFIAALLGGGMYQTYGAGVLFRVFGYSSGAWVLVLVCYFHLSPIVEYLSHVWMSREA